MNPFKIAEDFGYKPDEILRFAASSIPNFEDKIKYALAAGYSSNEVVKFLQNSFKGKMPKAITKKSKSDDRSYITKSMGKHEPDSVMQTKAYAKQKSLGDLLDPGRLAMQAGGAALGFAAGGPTGAVGGAYGGGEAHNEILKKYAEHIQSGGQMELKDYVESIIKGAGKGVAAAAALQQAPKLLDALRSGTSQEAKPDGEPPQPDQPIQPEQPQAPAFGPSEAFDIIKAEGLDQTFESIQAKTPEDMMSTLSMIIGKPRLKELSKKYGKPIEEIVGNAFMMKQGGVEATQSEPLATEPQPLAAEPEVMANQLETMATDPQPLAIEPEVKPLDTEEKAKPSPFKSKEPTTDDEKAIAKIMADVPSKMKATPLTKKDVKPIEALKSSNVRGATYHPDKTLQVVFESGQAYQYENVDKNDVQDFLAGASTTTTDGESVFRAFYSGKDKSIGSGFDKFIKKNADKYPPQKIDKSDIRDKGLNAIRKADQVEKASLYFDKFLEHNERAKSGQVKEKVKELSSSLKGLSDETENEIIYQIRQLIKTESSKRKKEGKRGVGLTPKNIAKEIDKRLKNG